MPAESDADIWMMQEVIDGRLVREWWRARLWTGNIVERDTQQAALKELADKCDLAKAVPAAVHSARESLKL